jgi:hypothetical protein
LTYLEISFSPKFKAGILEEEIVASSNYLLIDEPQKIIVPYLRNHI